jgi:hypothetical protein
VRCKKSQFNRFAYKSILAIIILINIEELMSIGPVNNPHIHQTIESQPKQSIPPRERWNSAISKVLQLTRGMAEMRKQGVQGKILGEDYWVEALTPSHPGPQLKEHLYREWRREESTLSFIDWLDSNEGKLALTDARTRFAGYVNFQSDEFIMHSQSGRKIRLADLNKMQVKYLSEEERKPYQINFESDSEKKTYLAQNGEPFCTALHKSHGKTGGAIFVVDAKGQFYGGSQVLNSFHHSSFLGGQAIQGGGELFVDEKGSLYAISNNTGHYQAGPKEMLNVLKLLSARGIDLNIVTLKIYNHGSNKHETFNAQQYLVSNSLINT